MCRRTLPRTARPRRGFTLIELLVVISLIAVLATLTVVGIQAATLDKGNTQRAVDRLTGALLIAKQRALRDQQPRGVRLITELNQAGLTVARQVQYVEVPEPYAQGKVNLQPDSMTLQFALPGDASLMGAVAVGEANVAAGDTRYSGYEVQPGDFIEVIGSQIRFVESVYRVSGVDHIKVTTPFQSLWFTPQSYRIHRQPRPLVGEEPVRLPEGVVIDIARCNGGGFSLPAGNQVIFSPSGGVLSNSPAASIVFWIANETRIATPTPASAELVAIQKGTGFIAAHPLSPSADPYAFVRDGRSSGM